MSTRDPHEYIPGEFTQFTRFQRPPSGPEAIRLQDMNGVNLLGYDIQLWDSDTGGVQLVENADYTLMYIDESVTISEGFNVYGGYQIINAAYQDVDLYITVKIVGGYTYRPYRPLVTAQITTDTVLGPIGTEDAAVLCTPASGAELLLTLPAGEKVNEMLTVISDGLGKTRITAYLDREILLSGAAQSLIWTGSKWVPVGVAGGGSGGGVAVGTVGWWPGPDGTALPAAALVCDGSLYNVADFPALFNVIGTTWGGDGVTTFAVPDLQGIVPGAFGTQDVGGNIKGDTTAIGGVREDQDQLVTGETSNRTLPQIGGTGAFLPVSRALNDAFATTATDSSDQLSFDNSRVIRTGTYSRSTEAVGRWLIQAFDSVTEIPADPAMIKDYVLKQDFATPTNDVPFIWEGGVFFIGVEFLYNGTMQRSNGLIAIFDDGIDRYFAFSADFAGADSTIGVTYDGTAKTISCVAVGPDYTAYGIKAIYRFENVSTASLAQPKDGWELKYRDWTNTGPVANIWGDGQYRVTLRNTSANATFASMVYIDRINSTLDLFDGSTGIPNYQSAAIFNANTGDFTVVSETGVAYIAEVWRFSGMVQVIHVTA